MEKNSGKQCRATIKNANANDSGSWVFTIGTDQETNYTEKDFKHNIKVFRGQFYCIRILNNCYVHLAAYNLPK